MKLGLSLTPNGNRGAESLESVRHLVWAAQFADEHDFDVVWSTEHHFTPVAFSSSPSVILSHYAAVTKRVKLGYAVAILPFHHPVRLAEEMAWIDNLSNGRLIAGVSPGWSTYEFSVFDVPLSERRERFAEGVTILKKALSGEKFSHDGRFWKVPETRIMPPPLQGDSLRWVSATTSAEGLEQAAQFGLSPLMGFDPPAGLADRRQQYIDYCRKIGVSEDELALRLEDLGAIRRILIRDTDEEAEEEAVQAVEMQTQANKAHNVDARTGQAVEGIVRRNNTVTTDDPRQAYAYKGTLFGSPETVAKKLVELHDVGLGNVVMQFHTTTRTLDEVKDNIRRFGQDVIPAYRKMIAEREAAVPVVAPA